MTKTDPLIQHYTLVEHTGLPGGVEERAVAPRQLQRILRAGGLVLNGYAEAHERAFKENYPDPKYEGIYPKPKGHFPGLEIEGEKL